MRFTCKYLFRMSKMIQIRNVPDDLHRRLKSLAALAGMSLSDYLLNEIRKIAEQPTWEEFRARLATRSPVNSPLSPAEIIREYRDRE
jgi:plasmid stability protein